LFAPDLVEACRICTFVGVKGKKCPICNYPETAVKKMITDNTQAAVTFNCGMTDITEAQKKYQVVP
jgi:hypothetical protein